MQAFGVQVALLLGTLLGVDLPFQAFGGQSRGNLRV